MEKARTRSVENWSTRISGGRATRFHSTNPRRSIKGDEASLQREINNGGGRKGFVDARTRNYNRVRNYNNRVEDSRIVIGRHGRGEMMARTRVIYDALRWTREGRAAA